MTDRRAFVLFELNEVPLRVVRHFADRNPGSAFARILRAGQRWDTRTPDQGHLSPWITWPTLHRGVSSAQHHIVALGQDVAETDRHFPPVWSLLAASGRRVGVFGSLHSYPLPANLEPYDFYVPDTFAAGPEAKPAELSAFQRFNLKMVDRSGVNVSPGVPVRDALGFLMRTLPAGIRPATLAKVARQLATERIWRERTGRRRTIQSLLSFDLFFAQLQSKKPDAAFYFTNHVASSMHRFWPATFTSDYEATRWSPEWVQRFSGELNYAMSEADQMLATLMAFADRNPDYLVLVSGSMGQAAIDEPDRQVRTQVLLRDVDKFLGQLGIEGRWERRRTMEPTYTLAFGDKGSADAFMESIARTAIGGRPIFNRRLDSTSVEFMVGHADLNEEELVVTIGNRSLGLAEAGLANVTIDDEVGAAAYHVPEGMLLAYDPRSDQGGAAAPDIVSTTRIAPTLLALQGVERPAYMERPLEELAVAELEPA
ncbi:MAG TPA: hypothetical protein VJM15_05880 [Sphingomicrobium sp.]|nr:hypothetical protein [Sphingomicrobium sp.]